jgi:hypothetical protein
MVDMYTNIFLSILLLFFISLILYSLFTDNKEGLTSSRITRLKDRQKPKPKDNPCRLNKVNSTIKAKREATKAKREAKIKAEREAQFKAEREAKFKAKLEAENKAKLEAENKAKLEAENKANL